MILRSRRGSPSLQEAFCVLTGKFYASIRAIPPVTAVSLRIRRPRGRSFLLRAGVLGAVAGVVGSVMAGEALKILLGLPAAFGVLQ